MKIRSVIYLLIVVLSVLSLKTAYGQTLRYSEEDAVGVLNPYNSPIKRGADIRFYSLMYENLYRYNYTSQEYESILIDSESKQDDGWYSFNLRDAVWHDGVSLTSEDVEFTISFIKEFDRNDTRKERIINDIDRIEIISEKEFRIKFDTSMTQFKAVLDFWILPKHLLDGNKGDREEFSRSSPVGTGPYMLDRRQRQDYFLTRFEKYHSKKPEKETIVLKRIPDTSSRIFSLFGSATDVMIEVPYDRLNDIESRLSHNIEPYQSVSIHTVVFNFENDILQNQKLRLAMALGFNRESALRQWYNDQGQLIASPYSRSSSLVDPNINPLPYSQEQAASILSDAGYVDSDGDGYLESPNGDNLEFNLIWKKSIGSTDQPRQNTVKDFIQNMAEIGIKITSNPQEGDFFSEAIFYDRDFDLTLIEWTFDPQYDIRPLFHSNHIRRGGKNVGGYSNSTLDNLFEKLYEAETYQDEFRIASQIQKVLAEDVPHIFMYNLDKNAAIDLKFTNVVIDPIYFFSYINQWEVIDE